MNNKENNIEINVSINEQKKTKIDIETKGVSKMELLAIFELIKLNTFERLNGNDISSETEDGGRFYSLTIN